MKNLMIAILIFISPLAFAGTGGEVTCHEYDNVVAIYTWFHSDSDSYSTLTVFVKNIESDDGHYDQYHATNEQALKPLTIKAGHQLIKVSPDMKASQCNILIK